MIIGKGSQALEFKKSTTEIKEAIISISSILNKHGAGTLYFGVKDDGSVIGQEIGKDTIRDVSRAIASNIKPSLWYEISQRNTVEGLSFIEISFNGNNAPYSAYGRYYQRFADEDKAISDTELEKLFKQRVKDYSEWENAKSSDAIIDADLVLLKSAIKEGNKSKHLNYVYKDKLSALKKFGLLYDSKTLNNAGRVLFSKNGPVKLKIATFATENKLTFLHLDHYDGNIFECIDKGINYILDQINYKIDFDGSSKRIEKPEIPLKAIREVVVNAFAHGEYNSNTCFEIDVYKDRVTIYSPGLFPRGSKPEDFALGRTPIVLNPKIVNMLFRSGKIESFGTGFERTFSECEKEKVKYSYKEMDLGFEFTFYRSLYQPVKRSITKTQKLVLNEIKKNQYITAEEIAKVINKSDKTVYRVLKNLKDMNMIERQGGDYNGFWKVLSND